VLLLDNSGSMERADRVRITREALRVLAAQLQPQDTFSIVTFARTPRLLVDGIPGNQAGQAADQVAGLTPEGGTNLEEALNRAYETALRHYLPYGINRVVLLTDGAANLGNVNPIRSSKKSRRNASRASPSIASASAGKVTMTICSRLCRETGMAVTVSSTRRKKPPPNLRGNWPGRCRSRLRT